MEKKRTKLPQRFASDTAERRFWEAHE